MPMPKSVIRQSAIQAGELYYFTNKSCKYGHTAKRLISTGVCVKCAKIYRHKNHTRIQKQIRAWAVANNGKINAASAKRHAQKLNATPPWLTKSHWEEIRKIYDLAVQKSLTVDHIIPLQGENVCGLHVPWNLQLLSAEQNFKKGNRF